MRRIRTATTILLLVLMLPVGGASAREFTGENTLGVETELMRRTQEGLDMVYRRQYKEALRHFREVGEIYPDSPVGPFGRSVVFQSMMLENFDYYYRDTYQVEAEKATALVEKALKSPDQKAWNYFLYAGIIGLDGLDRVREGDYLTAFNKGWDAIENMKKAKRAAPDFADPDLGLGIYNYWRTAITEKVDFLPRFGDHRAEGIAQMEHARDNGMLVWAGASFALAYTYMEERKYNKAAAECVRLQQEYPESVINNMLLGRIYTKSKDYEGALASYHLILQADPQNRRVIWHIADCYYKSRRHNSEARDYFNQYLEFDIPDMYRCHVHYRLGQIAQREKDWAEAERMYIKSLEYDPKYGPSKKRLEVVRNKQTSDDDDD